MELTSVFSSELRALVRNAPFQPDVFWKVAPTLSVALSPVNEETALGQLWDAFDAVEQTREIQAAKAMLGLNDSEPLVLNRLSKMASVHKVDQRTVRRWGEVGLDKITKYLVEMTESRSATCSIAVLADGNSAHSISGGCIPSILTSNGEVVYEPLMMDQAEVWLSYFDGEYHRRDCSFPYWNESVDLNVASRYSFHVRWTGSLRPSVSFSTDVPVWMHQNGALVSVEFNSDPSKRLWNA